MTYFLGIDTSTTATKAIVVDEAGQTVSLGRSEYGFETPAPGWSEQDPHLWWTATMAAVRSAVADADVDPSRIRGVGLTGQMHGLVALDASGSPVRPSILWNDQRTAAQCDEIRAVVGRERLIATTGNDALTGFTAPKLLWMRDEEPDAFGRIEHVLLPKDYIRLRLTGEYALDKAGGSGTLLFDLEKRDWSEDVVEALDIPRSWLPPTFEGTAVTGVLTAEAAEATGLAAGTPVFGGGGDQAANAVGVGAVVAGVGTISIGTSGVVFAPLTMPAYEPDGRLHAFCHAVPGMWHLMGVMLSAAGSYQWFRDAFAPGMDFGELDAEAADVLPGSSGLMFLPYLSGERTPHPDPSARGAFVGLTVRHRRGHLARAVMEGVAFGLRDSAELVRAEAPLESVRVSGGGAKSAVWLRILADILGIPLSVVKAPESAAVGAALLAGVGAGHFDSVADATDRSVAITEVVEPSGAAPRYDDAYRTYTDLYPTLRPLFPELARLDD